MKENSTSNLLRTTLKINGLFSLLTMTAAILFWQSSQALREMANNSLTPFIIQSVVFAGFVFFNAFRKDISKVMIYIIIVLDTLYVVGSLIRIIADIEVSLAGKIVIGFTALLVAEFAYFQYKGLKLATGKANT